MIIVNVVHSRVSSLTFQDWPQGWIWASSSWSHLFWPASLSPKVTEMGQDRNLATICLWCMRVLRAQ